MPRSTNKKPRRRSVLRIARWPWMEPDPKYRISAEPTPLKYVKTYINDYATGAIYRTEIDATRRAVLRAGGPELYGIYRLLVEYAGDSRTLLRGYLADHRARPASPETIAEYFSSPALPANKIAWAIRRLQAPEIALLQKMTLADALEHERLRVAALAAEGHEQGDEDNAAAAPGSENIGQPSRKAPTPTDSPGDARAGPKDPGGIAAPPGGGDNLNSNPNGQHPLATGQPLLRSEQNTGHGQEHAPPPQRPPGHGPADAYDHAHAHGHPDGAGQPPTDDGGDDTPTTAPTRPLATGPTAETGGPPPAALATPDAPPTDGGGGGTPAAPRPPSAIGHQVGQPTVAPAMFVDPTGRAYATGVFTNLQLPPDNGVRQRERELGAFASRWRLALRAAAWTYRHVPTDRLPDWPPPWVVDFGRRRLGKAKHLAERIAPLLDRKRMWMADFRRQLRASLQKYGPEIDAECAEVLEVTAAPEETG